ncbi:hypothetical protein PS1_023383 [Malus domestica]
MEGQQVALFQCQRIGCNAMFSEDDNPKGSCQYHDSGPIFHDGIKEWSCCKQRSHDFTLFLELPGCKTGKHTTEKPVLVKPKPKDHVPIPTTALATDASSKQSCSRCRQGFFYSDHEIANTEKRARAAAAIGNPAVGYNANYGNPKSCREWENGPIAPRL